MMKIRDESVPFFSDRQCTSFFGDDKEYAKGSDYETFLNSNDPTTFDQNFSYKYNKKSESITLHPGNKFGVYVYLDTGSAFLSNQFNTFILGNTIFELTQNDSNYSSVLHYCNIEDYDKTETSKKKFHMCHNSSYYIGRAPTELNGSKPIKIVNDDSVSKTHAFMKYNKTNNEWELKDKNSSNGIYVKLIEKNNDLPLNSFLRIGKNTYCYFFVDNDKNN